MMDGSLSSSNDEVLRKRLKPNPSASQVLDAIRCVYDVNPEQDVKILASLESYDDCNYCVELNGIKYLAKIYNGVETANYLRYINQENKSSSRPSAIHLYSSIFTHLQKYDAVKTSVPLQIPKKENQDEDHPLHGDFVSIHSMPVTSQEDSPSQVALCLLSWVEGTTMSSKDINIETLAQAGQYLAKVCLAMDDLPEYGKAAAMRYHAWDTRNTLDLEPFVRYITTDTRKSLVKSVLDAFRKELMETKVEFRMGVLQGDFNDANIILDQEGNVDGVIDFGDSTYR
jgi:Ser/Thr protein kinase RdoA (MazF antagonist)